MTQFQLWAGVFLRLLQKQREPLLIKCQPLALLLCLHPAKAREALDETVSFRARQTGRRTKAPEAFARDKPLLFQPAEKQGEVRMAITDLLPDTLQEQERLFQRRQMLPCILAGRISCAPAAAQPEQRTDDSKRFHETRTSFSCPGAVRPFRSTATWSAPHFCRYCTCGRRAASSQLAA